MKERIVAIFLLLLAAVTVWAIVTELPHKEYARPSADFSNSTQENPHKTSTLVSGEAEISPLIADEVIRLHILADSDSEQDQQIKLALRDVLLPYLNAATAGATTKQEALLQLTKQCEVLTEIANDALTALGVDYTATVSVETLYFPIRIYGSQTYLSEDAVIFPPGFYDSVQIVLGSGEGHNWWCLAYPSLCFIDASYDYVPKDSQMYKLKLGTIEKSKLEELFYGESLDELFPEEFPEDETKKVSEEQKVDIYLGSKLWELLKELFF